MCWRFLEFPSEHWHKHLDGVDRETLEAMMQWLGQHPNFRLSEADKQIYAEDRGRKAVEGTKCLFTNADGKYWVQYQRNTLMCFTPLTSDLDEATKWLAQLIENFEVAKKKTTGTKLGLDVADDLNNKLLLRFQFRLTLHGKRFNTPFTPNLFIAMKLRDRLEEKESPEKVQKVIDVYSGKRKFIRDCTKHGSSFKALYLAVLRTLRASEMIEKPTVLALEDIGRQCVVCMDEPSTTAFLPCGHRCTCDQCALKIMSQTCSLCPICRQAATSKERI